MPQARWVNKPYIIPFGGGSGQALVLGLILGLSGCGGQDRAAEGVPALPTAILAREAERAAAAATLERPPTLDLAATAASVAAADQMATADAASTAEAGRASDLATAAAALATQAARSQPEAEGGTIPAPGSTPGPEGDPSGPGGASAPAAAGEEVAAFQIPGVGHTWQKWNNCGPSSITMALSAYGVQIDQLAAAAELKPDREDTNVSPEELAAYARSQGFRAFAGQGGSVDLARGLLRAGVPVLAEQWIGVDGRGEMGHYRVVTGFDDGAGQLIAQDSYYGANQRYGYADFEAMWRPFLGAYVIAWLPEQDAAVRSLIGADFDPDAMHRRVLELQRAWLAREPGSAWAHFALGEAASQLGDHEAAVASFEQARAIGLPFRAFWYQFGYYRSLHATGRFEQMIALADETLAPMKGENLEESQYWKGRALESLGRRDEAMASYRRALEFNPLFSPAAEALSALGG